MSDPLVSGFTTGAAVHVFTSQVKYVFGLKIPRFPNLFQIIYVSGINSNEQISLCKNTMQKPSDLCVSISLSDIQGNYREPAQYQLRHSYHFSYLHGDIVYSQSSDQSTI